MFDDSLLSSDGVKEYIDVGLNDSILSKVPFARKPKKQVKRHKSKSCTAIKMDKPLQFEAGLKAAAIKKNKSDFFITKEGKPMLTEAGATVSKLQQQILNDAVDAPELDIQNVY